eukprot:TRINITY_DN368_c0_g1_i2.p2 TRINITY_DN368_c0_g1~~TRINITY_DN368_c0_g1_i2.p2  ORF type:complete len:219 (-),score=46.30 TRINITY_DN368_c0_g1_i2:653-1309(-)
MNFFKKIKRCLCLPKSNSIKDQILNEPLLQPPIQENKVCLVLDLDETLVHSSVQPMDAYDFVVTLKLMGNTCKVFVKIRPGAEDYLEEMSKYFEVIVFTASLKGYAEQVVKRIDRTGTVKKILCRSACTRYKDIFVKDLSRLGRDLKQTIIVDNSPNSYLFHPDNAMPITSWFSDMADNELELLARKLKVLSFVEDVRPVLRKWQQEEVIDKTITNNE